MIELTTLIPIGMFLLSLTVQVVGFVWMLAKMRAKVDELTADIKPLEALPERVSKLEWSSDQFKTTLGELREGNHRINNTLQTILVQLGVITERVNKDDKPPK